MNKVQVGNHHFEIADNWNRLSPKQLLNVTTLLNSKQENIDKGVRLLFLLTEPKTWLHLQKLTKEDIYKLLPLTDFLFEDPTITSNIINQFSLAGKKYHSPASSLKNISFGEWCFADSYLMLYSQTSAEVFLHKLIACLFRPQRLDYNPESVNYKGDIREDFNENLIDYRAELFSSLAPNIKQCILLFFIGCRNEIISKHPYLFPKKETDPEDTTPKEPQWATVLNEMAKGEVDRIENVSKVNAWTVFMSLEAQAIRFNKMKDQQEDGR